MMVYKLNRFAYFDSTLYAINPLGRSLSDNTLGSFYPFGLNSWLDYIKYPNNVLNLLHIVMCTAKHVGLH